MTFEPGLIPENEEINLASGDMLEGSLDVPPWIDNMPGLLQSSDQGMSSECAAYAMAGYVEFQRWKDRLSYEQIRPRPIYKMAKQIDEKPDVKGTTLGAVHEAARVMGFISEDAGPTVFRTLHELYAAIQLQGVALVGLKIDDGWNKSTAAGWIKKGKTTLGGHAVLACSYSKKKNWIGFQNSWGPRRGYKGFMRMKTDLFKEQFIYGITC